MALHHQQTQPDKMPFLVLEILFGFYVCMGLVAAAWIDFDFNEIYIEAIAIVCIPCVAIFYGTKAIYPQFAHKFRRYFLSLRVVIGLMLVPGHVLMVNAATDTNDALKRDTTRNGKVLTVIVERGGLGILYRKRW